MGEPSGAESARTHADWLHTIDNLTLTGYNPELSNKPYSEKRAVYAMSHFELNRYFGTCGTWDAVQIYQRAAKLFEMALQLWPRPTLINVESAVATEKTAPAGFHAECVRLAQSHLAVHFLKLAQTRYQSIDGQNRMVCAVSAEHNETGGTPYFWFAFHKTQFEFLQQSTKAWICLGCESAETTLLIGLKEIASNLGLMSVTKAADRHYWHIVVAKRMGRLVLRLLGGTDGPDLTDFNIGTATKKQ